jgi:hypothetical protein
MRGNAANVVQALEHYIAADLADSRSFLEFGTMQTIQMPSGSVRTKLQVVVEDAAAALAGRAIYWDAPRISVAEAEVIAYPYAEAMQLQYPARTISEICVWQLRRGDIHAVPLAKALGKRAQADSVLSRL